MRTIPNARRQRINQSLLRQSASYVALLTLTHRAVALMGHASSEIAGRGWVFSATYFYPTECVFLNCQISKNKALIKTNITIIDDEVNILAGDPLARTTSNA